MQQSYHLKVTQNFSFICLHFFGQIIQIRLNALQFYVYMQCVVKTLFNCTVL